MNKKAQPFSEQVSDTGEHLYESDQESKAIKLAYEISPKASDAQDLGFA